MKQDLYPRLTQLCASFPSLRHVEGAAPFQPVTLARHILSTSATAGSKQAVAFVLNVFDDHTFSTLTPFSAVKALRTWDQEHREAFIAYARAPWG